MSATCTLCGGDAGTFSPNGAHYLCEARAANGGPTPCLGMKCEACDGRGYIARSTHGVALFLDEGPGRIAQAIAAVWPTCEVCKGTRVKS